VTPGTSRAASISGPGMEVTTVTANVLFSIVIPVYNDWDPLERCLQSLSRQSSAPGFEVVVVDDGSKRTAPAQHAIWSTHFPLRLVHQAHAGISVARNRGVQIAEGSVLLFVDADCALQTNCLARLASTIAKTPGHSCFQLRLIGDCSRLVGRAEELRLITIQDHALQADGSIRYLNTAGFAMKRTRVDIEEELFDPLAPRGEDTLLLLHLIDCGELPLFVGDAIVEHAVSLSLAACFLKDTRSAVLARRANALINARGLKLRATNRERVRMLNRMWKTSREPRIGRLAWFVVVARQLLYRALNFLFQIFGAGVARMRRPTPFCTVARGEGLSGLRRLRKRLYHFDDQSVKK
jgi:glycosyltransferase involved in cell wall biosynthesis